MLGWRHVTSRTGWLHGVPTSGYARGCVQANVVMLPSSVATDFAKFCALNAQACPLLYQSAPGELTAPPLAHASNIAADIPTYRGFKYDNHNVFVNTCQRM